MIEDITTLRDGKQNLFRENGFRLMFCLFLAWAATHQDAYAGPPDAPGSQPLKVAFSSSLFMEVNEDDFLAAMEVWIMTVAREHGIPANTNHLIFHTVEDMIEFSRDNQVDGFDIQGLKIVRWEQSR